MTTWQRFGDGTWVNVDHLEVVRVDERDDGGWQLTATFTSGHTHPLGSHGDRELLIECTDAVLRGEVGQHLEAITDAAPEMPEILDLRDVAPPSRSWRFWRSSKRGSLDTTEGHPDPAQLQPTG